MQKTQPDGKPTTTTMFPKDWDAAKITAEIESAYADKKILPKDPNKWTGTSSSEVRMTGYRSPRTSVYPVMERKNLR